MKSIFLLFLSFVIIQQSSELKAQTFANGNELIEAMHEKYNGKIYTNFTFTQKTTFYGKGEKVERTQVWYEAMSFPGKLAIKFDAKDSNNGILFNSGVQYGFANGQLIQQAERVHDLLVLGFDIYHQAPSITAEQLSGNGYDLSNIYEDEWRGRPVYVVGVSEADSTQPQFWIDQERMVFVRNITLGRQGIIQEVQFNDYEAFGNGWVASEVVFRVNGQMGLLEEYTDISIPDTLDQTIFEPQTFVEADWQ